MVVVRNDEVPDYASPSSPLSRLSSTCVRPPSSPCTIQSHQSYHVQYTAASGDQLGRVRPAREEFISLLGVQPPELGTEVLRALKKWTLSADPLGHYLSTKSSRPLKPITNRLRMAGLIAFKFEDTENPTAPHSGTIGTQPWRSRVTDRANRPCGTGRPRMMMKGKLAAPQEHKWHMAPTLLLSRSSYQTSITATLLPATPAPVRFYPRAPRSLAASCILGAIMRQKKTMP